MTLLNYFDFSLSQFLIILFIVFIASIIRGFNGFGFSATCISGFSFILPAIEIVPIILILEVFISIFMIPYIWNKIDWSFVLKLLIGITVGSPIGDPTVIPINNFNTKLQSILFHMYGIIKILIKTSNIKMIGTISIAGSIKEKPEIHVAENPKPLNPLIIDAINTINKIIKN